MTFIKYMHSLLNSFFPKPQVNKELKIVYKLRQNIKNWNPPSQRYARHPVFNIEAK